MKKFIMTKLSKLKSFFKSYAKHFMFCVAFFCLTFNAESSPLAKNDFLTKYKTDLNAIEVYLNNIKDFSADFIQKSDSSIAKGKFYLSRPGKMRVEYDDEPQILIVVNGAVLTYKDLELDETSSLNTNTTPAAFLTRPNISFAAKDVDVTNVKKGEDFITVSVVKKNRPEAGEFSLTFKTKPNLQFAKMEVKNDLGQTTSVTLDDPDFSEKLSDSLFVIRNKNLPN